jgi:cytoskeleton protein RodZ
MTSIGECLRRERLRRSLQLEQVSSELKISARMLAAIEAEDFDKLPGGVFAKSFVRQYAHLLGLDEDEMAAEVERMLRPEQPAEAGRPDVTSIPLPRMEAWQSVADTPSWRSGWSTSLPALMLVVVVMLVCSAVYAFLQRPRQVAANNPNPPAARQQAEPAAPPPSAPPAQTRAAAESPAPTQPAEQEPAAATPTQAEAARVEPQPGAVAATPASAPAAAPGPPGPVHVEITATEPVWVRATSDGKYVFSGTIAANQSRTVDANESVVLRLGNAGAATILLNGKSIGEVGPKGQVRNIQLTSGGFQIVAAPKSPPLVDPL